MSQPQTTYRGLLLAALRSPQFITDGLQILKCVVATTAAWWLSVSVLDSELPFLAPWTALLTVHATVYRSLARGVQTTVASGLGVGLSFLIGAYLGVNLLTFALAILVGLTASRLRWIGAEGVAIATTAIFILGSGFESQDHLLLDRLIEVVLGVAVGVGVNLLVIPPLRDQQASGHVDHINRRMGEIMIEMADQLTGSRDADSAEDWMAATVAIDEQLESAWHAVHFAQESAHLNPRRYTVTRNNGPRRRGASGPDQQVSYEEILKRADEGVSHLRNMARTLRDTDAESDWDEVFAERWVDILRDAGQAIADPDAEVEPISDRLRALTKRFSRGGGPSPGDLWPVYGSLLTSMRHIAVIVDDVASAREAREQNSANPHT